MRVGDLAREAGVSRETIHFYLREELLPPAETVNARVSYFDESHLVRLRVIKERGRSDHIGEEHRDEPPLFGHVRMVRGAKGTSLTVLKPARAG